MLQEHFGEPHRAERFRKGSGQIAAIAQNKFHAAAAHIHNQ